MMARPRKKPAEIFEDDAKEETQSAEPAGEQRDLIDVAPENFKKMIPVAKAYRKTVKERVALTNKETELKQKLLQMVHEANLTRLSDGKVKFKCEGYVVTITPTDEKISIKEEKKIEDGPDEEE